MPRLFLGCPVPTHVAGEIEAWARQELEGVRVVSAGNLHVTLMFFGEVDTAERDELADLTRIAGWRPLPVETSDLGRYGRSALALELIAPSGPQEEFEDRVRFSCYAPAGLSEEALRDWSAVEWLRREADPMYQMALGCPERRSRASCDVSGTDGAGLCTSPSPAREVPCRRKSWGRRFQGAGLR